MRLSGTLPLLERVPRFKELVGHLTDRSSARKGRSSGNVEGLAEGEPEEVAEKVRTTSFTVDDLRGGTFTVTNIGSLGIESFTPVLNAPECWQADCHVHPSDQRVLGILDLDLSTADLEATMADARTQMVGFGLLTIVLICTVTGVLAWRVVHRPIHELLDSAALVSVLCTRRFFRELNMKMDVFALLVWIVRSLS